MMSAMKAENEKLAAAGGGGEGDSKLQEMLAAKQAELMVRLVSCFVVWCICCCVRCSLLLRCWLIGVVFVASFRSSLFSRSLLHWPLGIVAWPYS